MIIGGETIDNVDLNEAIDLLTGDTCTFVQDFTNDQDQQITFGAYLDNSPYGGGPIVCYENQVCKTFNITTGVWNEPLTGFGEDLLLAAKVTPEDGEVLFVVDKDDEFFLAAPSIFGGYYGATGSTQKVGVTDFASMTAKDDTIIFTGGVESTNKIEIWTYSSVSPIELEQISYSYELNLPRFAHCSTVFTHPSYGSVAAVIGGISQTYVAVEYIFLDDLSRAPIEGMFHRA